jgi:uncharacterized protein
MSTEHPHAVLMREFFDAFGGPDRDRLAALMTPDVVWHFPGTSAIAGDWHGVDGLLYGIRQIAMVLGLGNIRFELLHVYADDESAVTVHRDFYVGEDNELDLRFVLYVRMRDGRMAEVWEVPFDQYESDRYMGRQSALFAQITARADA